MNGKTNCAGNFTTEVNNGILNTNLFALQDIEVNNFITKVNEGYDDNTIGQIDFFNVKSNSNGIIKLQDNYFLMYGESNTQVFFYNGKEFRKGGVKTLPNIYQVSQATNDPMQLGAVLSGGNASGNYGYQRLIYISINENTLEQTIYSTTISQRKNYYGFLKFYDNDTIIMNTGDGKTETYALNRSTYTFNKIGSCSCNGPGIKIEDNYYLFWNSGGNTESWCVRIVKVNADKTLTAGTSLLFSTSNSGIPSSNSIIKFKDSNNIYVNDNNTFFKVAVDLQNLTCTATNTKVSCNTSYNKPVNIIEKIDGSKLVWVFKSTTKFQYEYNETVTYDLYNVYEENGNIKTKLLNTYTIMNNTPYMDVFPLQDCNNYFGLISNGININLFPKTMGFINAVNEASGLSVNNAKAYTSTLNAYLIK